MYALQNVISNILNSKKEEVSTGLLYSLIKNKKKLEQQISLIQDEMFNIKNITDYTLFETKKSQIIQKYRDAHKDQLNQSIQQQRLRQHQINIDVLISELLLEQQLKAFSKQFKEMSQKKREFLSQDLMINFYTIKLDDIKELKLKPQQVQLLFDLIVE